MVTAWLLSPRRAIREAPREAASRSWPESVLERSNSGYKLFGIALGRGVLQHSLISEDGVVDAQDGHNLAVDSIQVLERGGCKS